jgi:DNA-binding transcriptional LysR family regulator
MEFLIDEKLRSVPLPVIMSVTGPESYLATARLGLGLVQVPRFHAEADLADGTLVQVLDAFPPPPVPVSLLYPRNRQLSPRVRVFIDWLVRAFGEKT